MKSCASCTTIGRSGYPKRASSRPGSDSRQHLFADTIGYARRTAMKIKTKVRAIRVDSSLLNLVICCPRQIQGINRTTANARKTVQAIAFGIMYRSTKIGLIRREIIQTKDGSARSKYAATSSGTSESAFLEK